MPAAQVRVKASTAAAVWPLRVKRFAEGAQSLQVGRVAAELLLQQRDRCGELAAPAQDHRQEVERVGVVRNSGQHGAAGCLRFRYLSRLEMPVSLGEALAVAPSVSCASCPRALSAKAGPGFATMREFRELERTI